MTKIALLYSPKNAVFSIEGTFFQRGSLELSFGRRRKPSNKVPCDPVGNASRFSALQKFAKLRIIDERD
jgi:hypothetical protein